MEEARGWIPLSSTGLSRAYALGKLRVRRQRPAIADCYSSPVGGAIRVPTGSATSAASSWARSSASTGRAGRSRLLSSCSSGALVDPALAVPTGWHPDSGAIHHWSLVCRRRDRRRCRRSFSIRDDRLRSALDSARRAGVHDLTMVSTSSNRVSDHVPIVSSGAAPGLARGQTISLVCKTGEIVV